MGGLSSRRQRNYQRLHSKKYRFRLVREIEQYGDCLIKTGKWVNTEAEALNEAKIWLEKFGSACNSTTVFIDKNPP